MKCTTAEIITVGLGRLCVPMERVCELMNFLTKDNLFTHQLPRAFLTCEAWVKQHHPWLERLDESGCNGQTWRRWIADAELKYGKEHELQPLPDGQWLSCDPVKEAIEWTEDKSRVVVVKRLRNHETES